MSELEKALNRIEALSHSAWYYPGSKPSLEGEASQDIQYLVSTLREFIKILDSLDKTTT
jgi:hypothetical protein